MKGIRFKRHESIHKRASAAASDVQVSISVAPICLQGTA